jgi:hypothetical protein
MVKNARSEIIPLHNNLYAGPTERKYNTTIPSITNVAKIIFRLAFMESWNIKTLNVHEVSHAGLMMSTAKADAPLLSAMAPEKC